VSVGMSVDSRTADYYNAGVQTIAAVATDRQINITDC
jgi:hypothetical protein